MHFLNQIDPRQLMARIGVPLSQKRVMPSMCLRAEQRDFLKAFRCHTAIFSAIYVRVSRIRFFDYDVILDILPPFHAFGFTLGGLFGLLLGVKVAYMPNVSMVIKWQSMWKSGKGR